jgi:BASS family bile acid:Na+ symporter
MDLASLAIGGLIASIVLLVLSIGLSASPGALRAGLADLRGNSRALMLIFGLFPALALLLSLLLPLTPAVRTALLALAVSPLPPILPIRQAKIGVHADQALALQVTGSLAALVVAPAFGLLAGAIFGREVGFDIPGMLRTLLVTVFVPLALGLLAAHLSPALAARAAPLMRAGAFGLLVLSGLLAGPRILPLAASAISGPALAAILAMLAIGLTAGHMLGGPDPLRRRALALGVALRHPGVAIGLAVAADVAPRPEVTGAVLLYFLVGILVSLPYVQVAKRRAARKAA